ncbi:MAG: hypothetical protein LAT61_05880 [Alcanivorax sp.]|nr:hypothetical protein [Alcanivorax sp.]
MKSMTISTLPGLLALLLAACGGGGSSGGSATDRPEQAVPPEPGATGLSGQITAPNGETPIPGVTVYYTGSGSGLSMPTMRSAQTGCAAPPAGSEPWGCTDEHGFFVLEFGAVDPLPGTLPLAFSKGKWSGQASTDALGSYIGALPFPADANAGAPRIAVITGIYDQIEEVLIHLGMTSNPGTGSTALARSMPADRHSSSQHAHQHSHQHTHHTDGQPRTAMAMTEGYDICDLPGVCQEPDWLGSETFDLYIGSRPYGGIGEDYPDMEALFTPGAGGLLPLMEYDILYVNCDAPEPDYADWQNALTEFVRQGGLLYVTDLSSKWVSQSFYGYVDPDEGAGSVDWGDRVQVTDSALRGWLRTMPCGNGNACVDSNGRFLLTGYGDDVLAPTDPAVTPLVTDLGGSRVLTLRFPHGENAGQVFFSTFHTADGMPGSGMGTAEERMLEYLFYAD